MAVFVVLEPDVSDLTQAQERAVLVRDGFAFWAFVVPVIWLLLHRLWIEALAALALMAAAGALASQVGGSPLLGLALSLLTQLYFGLEARNLKINALCRRGWRIWGPVEALNKNEAELRYAAAADARSVVLENAPWPQRANITTPAGGAATPIVSNPFPWTR
ncbi:DUF2628 domain-containing protein [Tianweitania sp. BSSL-BM11]|uniref:DUF2628 domain-containing protein n=1 Tax=Tianweitania aestuarii TaxID=2814886 RepID=A0ABS5RX70_9HYPH|nr:DUF2628 domain-containing protein [Tianweitania aestuarii]MBS9721656.1 DUF2628 domain-containing protein [Tianweitania aestuarii]